jgi:hypothetical protein
VTSLKRNDTKNKKKSSLILDLEEGAEVGYCSELQRVLENILAACKSKASGKNYHLILIGENNEKDSFIKCLNAKLQRMGLFELKRINLKKNEN